MSPHENTKVARGLPKQTSQTGSRRARVATALPFQDIRATRTASYVRSRRRPAKRVPPNRSIPRVSVIIPCYNAAATIAETLASVFAQTFTDHEVILVNDGSPDTPALELSIAPWRTNIRYFHQQNRGVASARNTGIRASRGQLIAFLDSDDLWDPNYLEVQVGKLDADPAADIVYPNAITFGDGMPPKALLQSQGEVTFESLICGSCVVFTSVLARREALERAGLFDETLLRCEDFDLWLRCVKSGSKIIYHDQVLVRYRRHRSGSLSSNEVEMHSSVLRVFIKSQETFSLSMQERRALEEAIRREEQRKFFSAGKLAFRSGHLAMTLAHLEKANSVLPSWRLNLMLAVLRTIPYSAAKNAYHWRLSLKLRLAKLRYQMTVMLKGQQPIPA